MFLHSI